MASDKQRRKAAKAAKRAGQPKGQEYRHPDGDRRHRHTKLSITGEQALRDKKARREFPGAPTDDNPATSPG